MGALEVTIGLAKMTVIVIGIFMVPIITRKFAAELGLPIGQMAMNRAALVVGAGTGLVAAKVAGAAAVSALSHAHAPLASAVGSRMKAGARSLISGTTQVDQEGVVSESSHLRKMSAKGLHKLGSYLADSSLRLKAKKAGVQPPTLADKAIQKVAASPKWTAPIAERERNYQRFLKNEGFLPDENKNRKTRFRSPQNPNSSFNNTSAQGSGSSILSSSTSSSPSPQDYLARENPSFQRDSIHAGSSATVPTSGIQNRLNQTPRASVESESGKPSSPNSSDRARLNQLTQQISTNLDLRSRLFGKDERGKIT